LQFVVAWYATFLCFQQFLVKCKSAISIKPFFHTSLLFIIAYFFPKKQNIFFVHTFLCLLSGNHEASLALDTRGETGFHNCESILVP